AIENGFYYDFDLPRTLIPEDLPILEEKMRKIISSDLKFEKNELDNKSAIQQFNNQLYKKELVKDLTEDKMTIYKLGNFIDLCKGPHVEDTSELKKVGWKLDKIAGAYWKGSEKNKMLQRIYGLAFETKAELKKYEEVLQEAEKRDHRKLGRELNLFSFHEEAPGFPFWHPKGVILWNLLLDWWRKEHTIAGYQEIKTPIILARELWEKSGHWDHYKENMYFTKIDDRDFAVKPMNCPGAILFYKEKLHSYREFPLKIAEVGLVHRHELAGVLHGLLRVRAFHQDDAHIFCMPEQIESEVTNVIDLVEKMYNRLGLKYHLELSTRPTEGSIGSDENWNVAEKALENVLKKKKVEYKLNEGDGAFYGPKIDFHIEDTIGRTWQTATIQLDFAMPERFSLEYISENGSSKTPVMIHRVVFGAIERFIGILLEHTAGKLPIWLSPVQIQIIPVADKHLEYAKNARKKILEKIPDSRIEIDDRNETVGKKIRDSELAKVPLCIVVGDKEKDTENFSVRLNYKNGEIEKMKIDELAKEFKLKK
ncbi:MAG: threonyl-tRNA synthetase, partial [Candidatus Berkelbacteria bacterium Athens1014_28]